MTIGELFWFYKGLIFLAVAVFAIGFVLHRRACRDRCRGCGEMTRVSGMPSLCKACRKNKRKIV